MGKVSRRLYPGLADELKQWGSPHHHVGKVTKISDGDTVHVSIQLGFGVLVPEARIRLLGIDAPELVGPNKHSGQHSARKLKEFIHDRWVGVETYSDQTCRYGRWLAVLWLPSNSKLINVNRWMIDSDLAKPLKVNRFFDAKPEHMNPFLEACPQCNLFTSLIDGPQTMDPRNSEYKTPTKVG